MNNPPTSEKYNDAETESLQQQAIHEKYVSVIKKSLIIHALIHRSLNTYLNLMDYFISWYYIENWNNTELSRKRSSFVDCVQVDLWEFTFCFKNTSYNC